jgi:hypothetical protein
MNNVRIIAQKDKLVLKRGTCIDIVCCLGYSYLHPKIIQSTSVFFPMSKHNSTFSFGVKYWNTGPRIFNLILFVGLSGVWEGRVCILSRIISL